VMVEKLYLQEQKKSCITAFKWRDDELDQELFMRTYNHIEEKVI
jgi:hypothetical protein